MLEWVTFAADRVDALAGSDPEYRELAARQKALVDAFEALLSAMKEDDRELILDYMEAEGELLYRKTQLAYEYGKLIGRGQGK